MSIDWTNFELQRNTFARGQRDTSVVVFDGLTTAMNDLDSKR